MHSLSADRGDLGLVVTPFGSVSYTAQSGDWTIVSSLTADIEAFAYGRHGVTILASAGTAEIDGSFTATLALLPIADRHSCSVQAMDRVSELGGAKMALTTNLSEAAQTFGVDAEVSKSAIVISGGDGDGFVSSLIPKDGLRTDFDFGIAWSNATGLSFHGAAGLDATIPLNIFAGRSIPHSGGTSYIAGRERRRYFARNLSQYWALDWAGNGVSGPHRCAGALRFLLGKRKRRGRRFLLRFQAPVGCWLVYRFRWC